MDVIEDQFLFFATYGSMTDPGRYCSLFAGLPSDISSLCKVVQNNLLHIFWAERYGVMLTDQQKQSVTIRRISDKLALIKKSNNSPLVETRDIHSRQVGNCRDFSLLLTAFLRSKGIPARARCGFGCYFLPNHYEDHWICEYWNSDQSRWVMVDSQLDDFQVNALGIQFDPLDVPLEQFISGGRAWQMCRSGLANPDQFGIFDMHGWWFIWGNVIRDFLSLNKIEILPWDGGWGFLTHELTDPLPGEAQLIQYDQIAYLSATSGNDFHQLRAMMAGDSRFHLPKNIIDGF
ncbi:MAG TPA: transglutaminase-like domain-containing protein [Anaerolineales bacterium]|nr:transglutaminase-like domain-containing protein [Anaerolineales bacterium]